MMYVDKYEKIEKIVIDVCNSIEGIVPKYIVTKETRGDYVTEWDIFIQRELVNKLKEIFPEAVFICEEGINKRCSKKGLIFVIDPIDGTQNFVNNLKFCSTSIALIKDGEPVYAIIYNPYLNEMYTAIKEKGAYINHCKINKNNHVLKNSVTLFDISNEHYKEAISWELAKKLEKISVGTRKCACASLGLSYVAGGRCAMYFNMKLHPWDYAAGCLIIKEAGGVVKDYKGNEIVDYFAIQSVFAFTNQECYIEWRKNV